MYERKGGDWELGVNLQQQHDKHREGMLEKLEFVPPGLIGCNSQKIRFEERIQLGIFDVRETEPFPPSFPIPTTENVTTEPLEKLDNFVMLLGLVCEHNVISGREEILYKNVYGYSCCVRGGK